MSARMAIGATWLAIMGEASAAAGVVDSAAAGVVDSAAAGVVDSTAAGGSSLGLDAVVAALPTSILVYLALLVATYALHAAFMHYTVGGALWTLVAAMRGRFSPGTPREALAHAVRDWLPSAISGAITAGIAPLLFVQIVYQRSFYTANLLLFNRWMLLLPALIVAIYAIYAVKAHAFARGRFAKSAAAAVAALLIGYVGLAFVENHLLALAPGSWPGVYAGSEPGPGRSDVLLRLAATFAASLPTFALLALWQLRLGAADAGPDDRRAAARPLAILAIGGTVAALVLGFVAWHHAHARSDVLSSRIGLGAFVALVAAQAVAIPCWIATYARRSIDGALPKFLIAAATVAILAAAVLREANRLALLAGTDAAPREPAPVGGLGAFLASAILGLGVIAWIVRTVARALREPTGARH